MNGQYYVLESRAFRVVNHRDGSGRCFLLGDLKVEQRSILLGMFEVEL